MRILNPISKAKAMILTGLLIAAFALMILMRGCSADRLISRGEFTPGTGDTINVAIDYSPLSLYRYDDTLGGFNYDLIRMVAADLRRPVKYHPVVSFSKATDRLLAGDYDILVNSTAATASFRKQFRFTEPVYLDKQVLVSRDTTVKSQLNLGGRTIHVVAGSPAVDRLRHLSHEIGDTIYVEQDSDNGPEQLFIMAAKGLIPMAVVDHRTARRLAADTIDLSTAISFSQFQSWIMLPDSLSASPALADSIDASLRRIKSSPAYADLLHRYGLIE